MYVLDYCSNEICQELAYDQICTFAIDCHNEALFSAIIVNISLFIGRKTCYSNWNAEYNGYLMSSHKNHQRTDFTCVDINAEPCDDRTSNENGALFYPIRTKCGSLRCPPYTNEADLLCVVCTN